MSAQNTDTGIKQEARCPLRGERLLDSAASPWTGLRVIAKQLGAKGQLRNHAWTRTMVALVSRGHARFTFQSATLSYSGLLVPGSLIVIPQAYEVLSFAWVGAHEQVLVTFLTEEIAALAPRFATLRDSIREASFGLNDRVMELILRAMQAEIVAGCPSGAVFGESISAAFAARLANLVGSPRTQSPASGPTLTPSQQKRVLDYIRNHLTQEFGLAELARVIDASPSHFARVFRTTFGMPPYRYVIEQRILEAKRLMAGGTQSISEIALMLGFSSQSHFTVTFRKVTGTTPKGFLGNL
jgi:AraC family transcriptional regulator